MNGFQSLCTSHLVRGLTLGAITGAIIVAAALDAGATTNGILGLDGSSRISIANAPELNPTEGITIEAWIRPTSFSGFPTIVGKSFQSGYWLGLTNSGRVRYYANGSSGFTDGLRVLPLSQWTHVAVTFDGTTRRIYVDGALDREVVLPSMLPISADDLAIGSDYNVTAT